MLNELLRYVWNLLQERGGALLGLARRGLTAIRSLVGNARGLLRSVLKRIVSFVASEVGPAAANAGEAVRLSLAALKRRVEAVTRGEPAPAEVEEREAAGPETDAGWLVDEPVPTAKRTEVPESTDNVGAASQAEPEGVPLGAVRAEVLRTAGDLPHGEPGGERLAELAPVLRRALVRALSGRCRGSPARNLYA